MFDSKTDVFKERVYCGDVIMKDYLSAGRALFDDPAAFAPRYGAWGAEYAYCEPDVEDTLDAYLLYPCKGLPMRVELNQRGGRVCLGNNKQARIPDTTYCYVDASGSDICALFRRIEGQDFVRTLNMKSEIFINGKKVASCASHVLRDGDRVRMGGAEVLYRRRPEPITGTRYGF